MNSEFSFSLTSCLTKAEEPSQSYYLPIVGGRIRGVHTFPKGICPKVNVIARLEYELAYYDSAVHRSSNHYTTRTPSVRNFTFFKFRFSTRGERNTIFYYADCSSIVNSQLTDSTNARAVHSLQTGWPSLGPKNQPASSKFKSQLTAFIQNH